jgi:hypothetical protein
VTIALLSVDDRVSKKTLSSLSFCDEIISPTDVYAKVALSSKASNLAGVGDFGSDYRNLVMRLSKNDWILFLDEDEWISDDLQQEISDVIDSGRFGAFSLKINEYFCGSPLRYGEVLLSSSVRLVNKNGGKWVGEKDCRFVSHLRIGRLKNRISRQLYSGLKDFVDDLNRKSSLIAIRNAESGKSINILSVVARPVLYFLKSYFLYFGFLDGIAGFVYSLMTSSYVYLEASKQWLHQRGLKEIVPEY